MLKFKIEEKLQREGQKIDQFFSNLSESELGVDVYLDEQKWKVRDVLAHFISAEKSFLKLFENIRNGGSGAPINFSINEFNDLQVLKMKDIDSESLLQMFKETRSLTLDWIKGLTEEELEKTGRHPAMGESTIVEMIKMIYLHNQLHLRDMKSSIDSQQAKKKINGI